MAPGNAPSRQLLQCLRSLSIGPQSEFVSQCTRSLTTSAAHFDELDILSTSYYRQPDPANVFVRRLERRLTRAGTPPIGSRRRRVLQHEAPGIPFEQLPFQCFQEARKVLQADREEKLKKIEVERARIARLRDADPELSGGEFRKQNRLKSMHATLEKLKILADINDPMVKKRFEDELGDMNKPIYRYLADRKWREYRRPVLVQRITQMKVIPDVVPHFEPVVDVKFGFGGRAKQPGDFIDSAISESPCRVNVQSFDRGERLVTLAAIDSDVPDLENDSFASRCHFLASNIPISPTSTSINPTSLSTESQLLLSWLPPFAQRGSPYHRISIFVLEQKNDIAVDIEMAKSKLKRDRFSLRSFMARHLMKPIGVSLFRTKWDVGTEGVMTRAGIEGANVELKRIKVEPLPYKRRNPSTFR